MRTLSEALDQRVLLTDGSLSRQFRSLELDPVRDLWEAEDCFEILNLTRAPLVRRLHEAYLTAGADVIRTNSLGASPLSLAHWGLGDQAFAINYAAAQIACEAVDAVPGCGRRRFVLGLVRDQGWDVTPLAVAEAVAVQIEGLLAGGVDGIALDLTPNSGRLPMFIRGARRAAEAARSHAPIFLLSGEASTQFSEHARGQADGVVRYRHGGISSRTWLKRAVNEEQANLIGGGTAPEQTVTLDRLLRSVADDGLRPYTAWNRPAVVDEVAPASSSLEIDPAFVEM